MRKRISFILVFLILGFITINIARQIKDALNASSRLDQSADALSKLQEENKRLSDRLSTVKQYDFVEETARNKLNMAKSNESIVIIPQKELDSVLGAQKKVEEPILPNWQGWLKLIFH